MGLVLNNKKRVVEIVGITFDFDMTDVKFRTQFIKNCKEAELKAPQVESYEELSALMRGVIDFALGEGASDKIFENNLENDENYAKIISYLTVEGKKQLQKAGVYYNKSAKKNATKSL